MSETLQKLKWANKRSCIEWKNPFCVSSKRFCLKDNNKTAHWVGNSKLKPLESADSLKEKIN